MDKGLLKQIIADHKENYLFNPVVAREAIEPVLKRMNIIDEDMYARYAVGDQVRIIHGAFEGTEGTITFIDKDTHAVRIETTFFGRVTPVDVEFSEIEKI